MSFSAQGDLDTMGFYGSLSIHIRYHDYKRRVLVPGGCVVPCADVQQLPELTRRHTTQDTHRKHTYRQSH